MIFFYIYIVDKYLFVINDQKKTTSASVEPRSNKCRTIKITSDKTDWPGCGIIYTFNKHKRANKYTQCFFYTRTGGFFLNINFGIYYMQNLNVHSKQNQCVSLILFIDVLRQFVRINQSSGKRIQCQ